MIKTHINHAVVCRQKLGRMRGEMWRCCKLLKMDPICLWYMTRWGILSLLWKILVCITFIPLTTFSKSVLTSVKLLPLTNLRVLFFSWRIFADPLPLFFFLCPHQGRKQKRKQLSGLPRSDSHVFPLVFAVCAFDPAETVPHARFKLLTGRSDAFESERRERRRLICPPTHSACGPLFFFFQVWVVEEQGGGLLLHLKAVGLAAGGFKAAHLFKN